MKIIEKIRHIFSKETMFIFFKKIWGKPLPPIEDMFPQIKENNENPLDAFADSEKFFKIYNKLERKLFFKRLFISLIIISILYFLISQFVYLLQHNTFFACLGKKFCIVEGAKFRYTYNWWLDYYPLKLKNGNIFVYPIHGLGADRSLSKEEAKELDTKVYEIYNPILRKFNKNKSLIDLDYKSRHLKKIKENKNNQIVFISEGNPICYIDTKNNEFVKTNINLFNDRVTKIVTFRYITDYNDDYALIISNNIDKSHMDYTIRGGMEGFNTKTTKKENLYLFNYNDFSLIKLPDFALKLNYYPILSDFIVLNNGKIIAPIRYRIANPDSEISPYYSDIKAEVDHIEIYDPAQNKFIAETNKKVLKDNLFHIVFENNDVLFINKKSSYFFSNKKNKFIEAPKDITNENFHILDHLKYLLSNLGITIDDLLTPRKAEIYELENGKFLITCGRAHIINMNRFRRISAAAQECCRNTVYLDFKNKVFVNGPKLSNGDISIAEGKIFKVSKNTYWLITLNYENKKDQINRITILKIK